MKLARVGTLLITACLAVVFAFPAFAQEADTTATTTDETSESATTTQEETPQPTTDNPQPPDDQSMYDSLAPVNIERQGGEYASARVLAARIETEGTEEFGVLQQVYDVEIRDGSLKGKTIAISSDVESNPYDLEPTEGDKVVVFIQTGPEGEPMVFLEGFDRRGPMFWLLALFVITLVVLAGWQGFKVALTIILSVAIIGWVLIPSFLRGMNPVPIATALAVVFTFTATGLSLGWTKKAWITALGTLGGILVAYVISAIFADWAHLSGLGTEEDRLFFSQNPTLKPSGLLFAGIIIAAMGVVEDVAVSIASGVEQITKANPNMSFKALFTSGMVIGKDHMSAMANTLIFAYVGASLSTLLLYSQYDASWLKFLNFESVSEEVVRSLAATIGLIFAVPITALLSAWFAHGAAPRLRRPKVVVKEG